MSRPSEFCTFIGITNFCDIDMHIMNTDDMTDLAIIKYAIEIENMLGFNIASQVLEILDNRIYQLTDIQVAEYEFSYDVMLRA